LFYREETQSALVGWMNEAEPTPDTLEPITSGVRSNLVDIVKGIAIILVVYGHTAQGLTHRGWWMGSGASFSHAFVYSFHMPAFFFVAGLFVTGSIAKRGSRRFTIDKLKTILYPYVLLAIISVTLEPLIGRFKFETKPFRWNVFLVNLADGQASWFLFVLFFCLMLALVMVSGYTSINAVVKAELFPARIRTLGVGLPYAFTVAVFGGSAEYIALWCKSIGHEPYFYYYISGCIFLSLIVYLFMDDTKDKNEMTHERSG